MASSDIADRFVGRQPVVDSGTIESLAECVASVPRVTIVNNTMNKKQWARFAVEMNRTEKRIQSLGEEAEQRCQCAIYRGMIRVGDAGGCGG